MGNVYRSVRTMEPLSGRKTQLISPARKAVAASPHWYVASGHDYYVTLSATIYDQNGKVVDTVIKDSAVVSY